MNKSPEKRFLRDHWSTALKLLLAVVIIIVLALNTSISELVAVLKGVSPVWLGALLILFVVNNMTKALQYYLLVEDKIRYSRVLNVTLIQNVVSNLLATSAGIASLFLLFRAEHDIKASRTLGMFLLVKVGDLIQIWLFLLVSTWLVWDQVGVLHFFLLVTLTVMTAGITFFLAAIFFRRTFLMAFRRLISALYLDRLSVLVRLLEALESLVSSDDRFVKRALWRAVWGAFFYMIANLLWNIVIINALGLKVGVLPIVFVSMIQYLISYIPIQVLGGLGVLDLGTIYLLSLFTYETSHLIPVMFGWRILFYVMNIIIFFYLLISGTWGREKRAPKYKL